MVNVNEIESTTKTGKSDSSGVGDVNGERVLFRRIKLGMVFGLNKVKGDNVDKKFGAHWF